VSVAAGAPRMAALAGYLQAVRREYDAQDGEQLRGLLELDGPRSGLAAAGEAARSRADLLQLCGRALQPPLDEVRRTRSLLVSQRPCCKPIQTLFLATRCCRRRWDQPDPARWISHPLPLHPLLAADGGTQPVQAQSQDKPPLSSSWWVTGDGAPRR
jgi:hypothetical protein